jgi:lipopolysaccharide export system protein LptA
LATAFFMAYFACKTQAYSRKVRINNLYLQRLTAVFIHSPFLCSMRVLVTIILLLWMQSLLAQVPPPDSARLASDTSSRLQILKAERYNFEKKDSVTSLLSLAGNVILKQDLTWFYADSAVLNQNSSVVEAYGNVHINDNDSLHTYARYMRYNGKEKKAFLKDNVKLTDAKGGVLTTSELYYDLNTKIATYTKGGKVVNEKTVLTSKEASYFEEGSDVVFKKSVVLHAPDYDMYTDSLQYNTETEIATFIAPTTIVNGNRRIYTTDGYYDLKAGKAFFAQRSSIVDSSYSIVADQMAFEDKTGLGQFRGNVVFVDTANGVSILSNQLFANNKTESFLATEKPLMILRQDKDSLYITADSLYSGKITSLDSTVKIPLILDTVGKKYTMPDLAGKDSSQNRFFRAWYHVRIFSDSLQAVCDSMFYAGTDSAFRLFRNPIVWASESQITADTMYLFTKNKKPEKLLAYFNGFIVNRAEKIRYNQVKGNTINALFVEGEINYVRAKGRAESVYYALDDLNKFVGMNRATSDAIDMFFVERKPVKVKFINDLKGTTYPMSQIPPEEDTLKGFKWQEDLRPKTREEMLGM